MWLRKEGRGGTIVLGAVVAGVGTDAGAGGYVGRASPCSAASSGSVSSLIGVRMLEAGAVGD